MPRARSVLPALSLAFVANLAAAQAVATRPQTNRVTSPKEQFGFNIGDDYNLVNYTQLVDYLQKLDRESNRLTVVRIGTSAEGRPILMSIVTAPENHRKLDRYREISRRLTLAEGLTEEQARGLAAEGRAVVWIDGGLHATEVLGAQQLIETVYQLVSRSDAETMRFLRDDIVLATLVNPDGMELVSNWYMRNPDPQKRSTSAIPRLYQKYIGHDNNRDFYMSTQPETEAINRVFYHEWFPQIVYNHHQTGPAGTVMFAPPFRDPFNYNFDPLVVAGIDLVGAAMHSRFLAEGKPGVTMRRGANYSTWWNGGLRTTVYFHNMVGLLTETIGNPTPIEIPFLPQRQLPSGDLISPIPPQKWHFRQSVDYSITANRAVMDVASRYRETLLFNAFRMGKNSIERGNKDWWTTSPSRIEAVQVAIAKERDTAAAPGGRGGRGERAAAAAAAATPTDAPTPARLTRGAPVKFFAEVLRDPARRDARAYVIPSSQPDFQTATKFVNALIETGVAVHRATGPFEAGGKSYPAGSYVVRTAQAFRPHVRDMFEPQDHPNDFSYPGGPPIPPYDNAGYTLAYQMGVQFDRILDGVNGPFEKVTGVAKPPAGTVAAGDAAGYFLSHQVNDAFIAVNRLLKNGDEVYWTRAPLSANGKSYATGTFYIAAKSSTRPLLQKMATELGLTFDAAQARPTAELSRLRPMRVGLWDRYGGSMPSGWIRWILEQMEFPFEVVYAPTLDAGGLAQKYDVLIFVGGAIPERDGAAGGGGGGGDAPPGFGMPNAADIPQEFRSQLGTVTVGKTVPQLRQFLEGGGTILTIGSSANLAYHLGLPITSALAEKGADGTERALPREKFYIPGSVLQVRVDSALPVAHGMPGRVDVFFDESPAFRLGADAAAKNVRAVAWFDSATPLRSGWAWGQKYLENAVAVAQAPVGKGMLYLFGPEITFRAQPHGTFKFLFNGIYAGATSTTTAAR